jgi:hypothetical protein
MTRGIRHCKRPAADFDAAITRQGVETRFYGF